MDTLPSLLLSLLIIVAVEGIYIETSKHKLVRTEGNTNFAERVAVEGETATIICKMAENQELWHNQKGRKVKTTSDGRITQSRDAQFLNTTIHSIQLSDRGSYRCGTDYQNLKVYRYSGHEQVPPQVTESECVSYTVADQAPEYLNLNEFKFLIVCTFNTTTVIDDYMDWSVSLAKRDGVPCEEGDDDSKFICRESCINMLPQYEDDYTVAVSCLILTSDISTQTAANLEFSALAKNLFIRFPYVVNTSVRHSLPDENLPKFMLPELETIQGSTTPYVIIDTHDTFVYISGAKWVQEFYTNAKWHSGYVAKLGDNISISCSGEIEPSEWYDMYDVEDKRIKVVEADGWYNTTIQNVTHEDVGVILCGTDYKKLEVVDTEKIPRVISHQCESTEFEDMICTFRTNTNQRDLITWAVLYDVRNDLSCGSNPCHSVNISCQPLERSITDDNCDQLTCYIMYNQVYRGNIYDFHFTASNPFVKHSTSIKDQVLNLTIVQFSISNVSVTSVQASSIELSVQINNEIAVDQRFNYKVTYEENGTSKTKVWYNITLGTDLLLEDLKPYTEYNLNVSCQLRTKNMNNEVWGEEYSLFIHSGTAVPDRAPDHSITGYQLETPTRGCPEPSRLVTLLWKPLLEKAGFANGKVESYSVYDVSEVQLNGDALTGIYNLNSDFLSSAQTVNIVRENSSATVCFSENVRALAIIPSTSAGLGKQMSYYELPASNKVMRFKSCRISVKILADSNKLSVTWPNLSSHLQKTTYTVYWCVPADTRRQQCVPETLEWRDVGISRQFEMPFTANLSNCKFGLSAKNTASKTSSGIVWSKCVDDLRSTRLVPAKVDVQIYDMKAIVKIIDKCSANTRRAESYTIKSCLYDSKQDKCEENAEEHPLSSCENTTTIDLHKYSSNYSFWVTSYVGDELAVDSERVHETVGKRGVRGHEIVLICIFVLILTTGLTLLFIWIYRQRKLVKSFKRPQLIIPLEMKADIECTASGDSDLEDATEEKDHSASDYLIVYSVGSDYSADEESTEESFNFETSPLAKSPEVYGNVATSLPASDFQPYVNHDHLSSPLSTLDDNGKTTSSIFGYQPVETVPSIQKPCRSSSGLYSEQDSLKNLSDDSLRYTLEDPEQSLSAQLFLTSSPYDTTVIDISKFLVNSGSDHPTSNTHSNTDGDFDVSQDSIFCKQQTLDYKSCMESDSEVNNEDDMTDEGIVTALLNDCSDNSGNSGFSTSYRTSISCGSSDTGYVAVSHARDWDKQPAFDGNSSNCALNSSS